MPKPGRNQPCPCGSGQKFKRCHGAVGGADTAAVHGSEDLRRHVERQRAQELIRRQQQGSGRPIISAKLDDYRVVAVGNEIRFSKRWKVFSDFLGDYLKIVTGSAWGNAEIAKPLEERHPILQWYDGYCRFQRTFIEKDGEVFSAPGTGVAYCYLGLAYNLYLIKHNVELQDRLLKRLREPKQFQGAYYELIVANILIRAGFALELEDEADEGSKHCEFSAVSKATGEKYWVEAKMRSVVGVLGKTKVDGTLSKDPTAQMSEHIRLAFQKPAADKRLVFVDLNAPGECGVREPSWGEKAARRLDAREANTPDDQTAYVFVTNFCHHRHLEEQDIGMHCLAYGLKMPDFGRPGLYRLSEVYRAKQKHADAHRIGEAIQTYPQIPVTFDGGLPSEFGGEQQRVLIGEHYFFEDIEGGIVAEVVEATVLEPEKRVYLSLKTNDGRMLFSSQEMTEGQLQDYRAHKEAYFGVIRPANRICETLYDFYEWMVETHSSYSKERLLQLASRYPDLAALAELSHQDLVIELCERWASAVDRQTGFGSHQKPDQAP